MAREYQFCPWCAKPLGLREDGGKPRKACGDTACGFVHYDNPIPAVAAIVERDGTVLLVRQAGWPEKFFALVAGFLERDETPEEGVLREVREELGVTATIESFVGVYPFLPRNELMLVFHVKTTEEVQLGEELEACKPVPIENLRPWPMGTGPALADWIARRKAAP